MGGREERGVVGAEAGGGHPKRVSAVSGDRLAGQGQSHVAKGRAGKEKRDPSGSRGADTWVLPLWGGWEAL